MQENWWLLVIICFPFVGGIGTYIIGRKSKVIRDLSAILVTIIEFFLVLAICTFNTQSGSFLQIEGFCGKGLTFTLDGFRTVYSILITFSWMATTLFSREYFAHYRNRNRYYLFHLFTLGATLGVFLSADFFTTFIFFEIMSFTSYVWVVQEEKKEALRAGATYLTVAIVGGLVMLMGLFLLQSSLGTLAMDELRIAAEQANKSTLYMAGICILVGFGAKAGAFPLHIWLPKAHPVAPAPASALLSGILTKSGIFGIILISTIFFAESKEWGMLILVIGLITMFWGAFLAMFSNHLKRTLACSSMSQIGFILVGIAMMTLLGEENILAARGTFLHMVNHSLLKLVLFLVAGVVYMNLHKLDFNSIRGFGRKKPLLHFAFLSGALGIGGIPFFNGYVSKTLLHESIVEYKMHISPEIGNFAEVIFLLTGGLTIAYMLKTYLCLFVEKNQEETLQQSYDEKGKHYMSIQSALAFVGVAVLFPIMGMFPNQVMDKIADRGMGFFRVYEQAEEISYFSLVNLKGAGISLIIGLVVYFVFIRLALRHKEKGYINPWPAWIDLEDSIYRPTMLEIIPFFGMLFARICDTLVDGTVVMLRKTVYQDRKIPHELKEGSVLTHFLGKWMDRFANFKSWVMHKKRDHKVSYTHRLAVLREEIVENNTIISRSLSFGLFMFSLGLCLTLLYLLFAR